MEEFDGSHARGDVGAWLRPEHDSREEAVTAIDMVNQPPHYKFAGGVEVIDLTEQLNFNCGNAVKYICRAGRKDTSRVIEDLRKAEFYVRREIARRERAD